MRIHGRNGVVYLASKSGQAASPLTFQADWAINAAPARPDLTAVPDTSVTYGVPEVPDINGDFSGWYDDATAQTYLAAVDGLPRAWYLYPSSRQAWRYFYGMVLPDFQSGGSVAGAVQFKATWSAAGFIGQAGGDAAAPSDGALSDAPAVLSEFASTTGPPVFQGGNLKTRPVVQFIAGPGQFFTLPKLTVTPSGHSFRCRTVPGWQWGNGQQGFYTRALPDGQVAMSTLSMASNELSPTGNDAEFCVYNPVTGDFYRQVIPTSAGALTAVNPANGLYGGTDVGSGDLVLAYNQGVPVLICTCEGYYFGWSIPVTGLYPTFAKFGKSGSRWLFLPIAVNFLTGQNTGFEGGIGNWAASVNCTVAATSAQAHTGSSSLGITSAAAGDMVAASCAAASVTTQGLPVSPGQSVLCSAWARSAVSARACSAGVAFYDGSGNPVGGNTFGTAANDVTSGWTQIAGVFAVPAGAAFCRALVKVAAAAGAAELHYADDVVLMEIDAQSLTGDQWELTNPATFTSVIGPGGQLSGNGASYWGTRGIGQMAVLPASGNIVIGHYFDTGSGTNAGCISVIAPDGSLVAAYQIPNLAPNSGTLTSASVRDVEADPTGVLGDERFVIMYDAFGTGAATGHPFQEFSFNATGHSTVLPNGVTVPALSAGGIAPVSAPCEPADGDVADCAFCCFGPDGALYVTTFAPGGLAAGNLQVYLKPPGGMRSICTAAPATGTWATTGWKTLVGADHSLNFPAAQGLAALNGPLVIDPVSNAIIVPGASGKLAVAYRNGLVPGNVGPNLLGSLGGFEPAQLFITDDQIFQNSRGTWIPFLGSFTGPSVPPVAPPQGVNAMHCTPAFGSLTGNTARYSITQNTQYEAAVSFLATTATRTCEVYYQWYNAAGSVISTSSHVTAVDSAAAWTTIKNTATSPNTATAVQVFFVVDSPGAGEVHWVSSCSLVCLSAAVFGWSQFVTNVAITDAQALDGSYSLAISAPFNNETVDAVSPPVAVVPLTEYRCQAWFRAAATPQPCKIVLSFRDASNTVLTQVTGGPATDSTTGWTMAQAVGLAPAGAATVLINLEVSTSVVNETHYADRVSLAAQPWSVIPAVDFMLSTLRGMNGGAVVNIGRPALIWPYLYIPVSQGLTSAEQTAYNSNLYIPAPKPQYLAAVDLSQLIAS